MNILNVAGNAVFIYGFGIGTFGAAVSTTISRTVAAVLIFCLMFNEKRDLNFKGQVTLRFRLDLIKKICYIGLPNSMENSLFQLGKILTVSMISTMGTYAIAANAVCNTIASFNILPGAAINSGIVAIVSVCIGAGKPEQARYYSKKLMKAAWISLSAMSLVLMVSAGILTSLYHLSPEATNLAKQVLWLHAVMVIVAWVPSFTLPNVFRAAGDAILPMAVSIGSMWIFRLGCSYLLGIVFKMGLLGVWTAMVIDWIFRSIFFAIRFRSGKWEKGSESQ